MCCRFVSPLRLRAEITTHLCKLGVKALANLSTATRNGNRAVTSVDEDVRGDLVVPAVRQPVLVGRNGQRLLPAGTRDQPKQAQGHTRQHKHNVTTKVECAAAIDRKTERERERERERETCKCI